MPVLIRLARHQARDTLDVPGKRRVRVRVDQVRYPHLVRRRRGRGYHEAELASWNRRRSPGPAHTLGGGIQEGALDRDGSPGENAVGRIVGGGGGGEERVRGGRLLVQGSLSQSALGNVPPR